MSHVLGLYKGTRTWVGEGRGWRGVLYHNCINIFVQNPNCYLQAQATMSAHYNFKSKSCNFKKLNHHQGAEKGFFFPPVECLEISVFP